ncbi:MAG TPA: phosphoribosyltransferase [Acidobacteriaceae bacterium]|jgi:predicted phosphoribosyltransferase|nr:phosphoribosyltransferase [Acidobacteriaceae bacterium]
MSSSALFDDRREAGRLLAAAVRDLVDLARPEDPAWPHAIVLALPRGGVPVGFEVARELRLPLDVFVVRKLGVPGDEELAMGAIASGGVIVVQPDFLNALGIPPATLEAVAARERLEIERREALYRASRPPLPLAGRTAIVVDDGAATGSTMKAAVRALRSMHSQFAPRRIVVAIPLAAPSTRAELEREADQIVCLATPEPFHAVGSFYRTFEQTSDDEVRAILAQPAEP